MVLCGRFFCMGQTLVNGGFGASDADDGGGDLFQLSQPHTPSTRRLVRFW